MTIRILFSCVHLTQVDASGSSSDQVPRLQSDQVYLWEAIMGSSSVMWLLAQSYGPNIYNIWGMDFHLWLCGFSQAFDPGFIHTRTEKLCVSEAIGNEKLSNQPTVLVWNGVKTRTWIIPCSSRHLLALYFRLFFGGLNILGLFLIQDPKMYSNPGHFQPATHLQGDGSATVGAWSCWSSVARRFALPFGDGSHQTTVKIPRIHEYPVSMAHGGDWFPWNFEWLSHHIGNFIIPTDEVIFFRGVGIPPTR
jgi:hypothetical protein